LILKLIKLLWPLVAALSDFSDVQVPDAIKEEQREVEIVDKRISDLIRLKNVQKSK
jgi:hypothetical protein